MHSDVSGGMVEKAIKFEQSGGFKFALGVLSSVYAHNISTGDWTFTEWCGCKIQS
jgi:hypothetical protein